MPRQRQSVGTGRKGRRRKRATYHHGDLKQALINTAAVVIDRYGCEALTLREAARRAGVSHNAPYRHFSSVDDLVAAVAADGILMLIEELESVATDSSRAALASAYARFAAENPGRFALMFGPRLRRVKSPAMRDARAALVDTLFNALGTRALAVWCAMHGLAALHEAGFEPFADTAKLTEMLNLS